MDSGIKETKVEGGQAPWWWRHLTRHEQEQYLQRHPHSHLKPTEGELYNRDRARSKEIMQKIRDRKRSLGDHSNSGNVQGFPAVADHLVKYLSVRGDKDSMEFLDDLRSSLKRVSEFNPKSLTNVDRMRLWTKDVALRYPDKIRHLRESMDDGSILGRNAIKSLDEMLGAAVKHVKPHKHASLINREFALYVISKR